MKLIVLAAGYATRLYPLTLNQPKPLLSVAGKPMIEHVLEKLSGIEEIDQAYIVTNDKFVEHFEEWARQEQTQRFKQQLVIVNDKCTDDSNKLGAIGDLHLVLTNHEIEDDIIVVAGDNLFSEHLSEFAAFSRNKNAPVLAVYDVGDLEEIKKYNTIHIDTEDRITYFEEKPAQPESTLTGIALYYYPEHSLELIREYIARGNNPDQPGRLVQWMYPQIPFYTWRVPGLWYDVGSLETLNEANRIFGAKKASG